MNTTSTFWAFLAAEHRETILMKNMGTSKDLWPSLKRGAFVFLDGALDNVLCWILGRFLLGALGGVLGRFLGALGGVVGRFLGALGGVVGRFLGALGGVVGRFLGALGGVIGAFLLG